MTTRIVIYDNPDASVDAMRREVAQAFPNLESAEFSIFDIDQGRLDDLPPTDIGVCTYWASAYLLLRFNRVRHKYYFIQDYEAMFYPPGPSSALAESTYRFGFSGIVNTPGLLDALRTRHGLEGVSFVPAVDARYYHPPARRRDSQRPRIFFYARPTKPRNAFELGVVALRDLLSSYGDRIEVVAAGSEWNEKRHGLERRIVNLGLLQNLSEVGALYRTCDIGLAFSLSKHPSYQPFEFMASGMATVTNRNEDNLWLLQDGVNCLLSEASPAAIAEKVAALVDDAALRSRISAGGLATVSNDWGRQIGEVWTRVVG